MALASDSWRELIEIEIRAHPNGMRIDCPEIHVSPGGTGLATKRLRSSIVSVWLRETVRMWGILRSRLTSEWNWEC